MLEIPNGINVDVKDNLITISGSLGKNKRVYNDKLMNVLIKDNQIHIECTKNKKLAKVANNTVNTLLKELKNDMDGVNKHFEIKMLAVFAHFPITIEVKNNTIIIKNILGARAAIYTEIVGDTKIEIKGQNVRIYGTNKEDVSQTAANIRMACKVRKRDERVFQDGVYYAIE
jgi:large subunit ribosomal protein L6